MSPFFPSFLRTTGLCFIAMALFSLAGGHWAVFQGVAWAQMIRMYSTQESLVSAVQKTVSGQYRCSLCKKITQAQQQEKKATASAELLQKKKTILVSTFVPPLFFPSPWNYPSLSEPHYVSLSSRPLIRPPRLALG